MLLNSILTFLLFFDIHILQYFSCQITCKSVLFNIVIWYLGKSKQHGIERLVYKFLPPHKDLPRDFVNCNTYIYILLDFFFICHVIFPVLIDKCIPINWQGTTATSSPFTIIKIFIDIDSFSVGHYRFSSEVRLSVKIVLIKK
jgi:hypothetical protein